MIFDSARIPTVIPVAGGKGGVGKSLFTACLARAFAATGRACTAVDLDLGGSNLHSFFGLENVHPGIGDFIASKGATLADFEVELPSGDPLRFIPGDGLRPFLANLSHLQKIRLLRELPRLGADLVLLDLGAGSSYNTLDFFRVWGRGIVLTTPEYTAIMNMMNFLKNVVLRVVAKGCQGNSYMEEVFNKVGAQGMHDDMTTIPQLLAEMAAINLKRTAAITDQLEQLQIDLIVNQVRDPADLTFVRSVQSSLQKRLGLRVNWQGSLFEQSAARGGLHVLNTGGVLPNLAGIEPIAGRIVRGEVVSSDTLLAEAQETFNRAVS